MELQLSVRELLEESLNGNFAKVLEVSKSGAFKLETGTAVKVIAAVCNACHRNLNTPYKLDECEMAALLKRLLKFIYLPKEELFTTYSQSVIHILKFLVLKESFKCLLTLEDLVIPEFMPILLTEPHQNTYSNICKIFHNVVITLCKKGDLKYTLPISQLLVKTYRKINKKAQLVEGAQNCIRAFISFELHPNQVSDFHQFVLTHLDRPESGLYASVITTLSLITNYLYKKQKTDLVEACFDVTKGFLGGLKGDEYDLLSPIMAVAHWINPSVITPSPQTSNKAHSSLKTYHRIYGCTPNLQAVCGLISASTAGALTVYKKSDSWEETAPAHLSFYKFLYDVGVIMAKAPSSCLCCSVTTNLHEAIRTLNAVASFGRISIKGEVGRNCKLEVFRVLEKMVEFVKSLKKAGCQSWGSGWYNCGSSLYTIGMRFYNSEDWEMVLLYLQKYVKSHLELEGSEPSVISRSYLSRVLNAISDSYFENGDYEHCLMLAGLAVVFSENPKAEMSRWIRAKVANRENSIEEDREVQEVTVVGIFEKYREDLRIYLPPNVVVLSKERKIELLVLELRQYNAKWKSKIPMSATYSALMQFAPPHLAAELFVEVWGEGDQQVHETVPTLLRNTIKGLKRGTNMLSAHLHFLQHKYRVREVAMKNYNEMERSMSQNGDLIPSYNSIKLGSYGEMMGDLNMSLEMLHGVLEQEESLGQDRQRIFTLLTNIGHEYSLHGDTVRALQAWDLSLKVADTDLQRLQATGLLLPYKPEVPEACLDALKSEYCEDVIAYLLSKAEAYFHEDFTAAYSAFLQALELTKNRSLKKVLKARLDMVHHRFIMMPCHYEVVEHLEKSLVKIHQAASRIFSYYEEATNISSYDIKIYLEIQEVLVRMYFDLRLPRQMIRYAKKTLLLAEKLVLPLRTLTFLFYLVHSDITTLFLDEARIKLKDFSDILGIESCIGTLSQTAKRDLQPIEALEQEFGAMMLDVPRPATTGSPIFASSGFKKAPFMSHEISCECFYCTCWQYQDFVLKNAYLHALLHQYDGNKSLSKDFFSGCQKIYMFLKVKSDYYMRAVRKMVAVTMVPTFNDRVLDTYCYFLLEYANFLIRNDKLDDADTINKRAIDKLESTTIRSLYLYNELLAQRVDIIKNHLEEFRPPLMGTSECDLEPVKTPSPRSNRCVSPLLKAKPFQDLKVQPKILTFDISDEEDEQEPQSVNLKVDLPAFLRPVKTPAPKKGKPGVLKEANKNLSTPSNKSDYLMEKTRLLTEKLASSSKKSSGDSSKGRGKVRQNLMGEMEAEETVGVRRSARNKRCC